MKSQFHGDMTLYKWMSENSFAKCSVKELAVGMSQKGNDLMENMSHIRGGAVQLQNNSEFGSRLRESARGWRSLIRKDLEAISALNVVLTLGLQNFTSSIW